MTRIAHISDTHLGSKPKAGVRHNVWGQEMRSQLLENDFYERFEELFEIISELDPPVDLVVHSGDLYNSPWEGNPSQPPVVAQETAIRVLQNFTQETGIPVLILEGNHGLYRLLEVSLLETLKLAVPGLDVATQQDLKEAIRDDKPLVCSYDKLDIFCFPFIDYAVLEKSGDMLANYDDWITSNQVRDHNKPTIAVAHGMEIDNTLHKSIFTMDYDYIALGHDHHQHKHSAKSWYAGSPERWRFDELKHDKGFIIVDIEETGKDPVVTPHHLTFERPVISEKIDLAPDDTLDSITERVYDLFTKLGLKDTWNPKTAARLRLIIEGKSSRMTSFELGLALESLRLRTLSKDSEYNIAQFVWFVRQHGDEEFTSAAYPEIESEYLIQDPEEDFQAYLGTLEVEKTLDTSVLTKIAVRSLEYAVDKREGKMTSESITEDEK